MSETQTPAAEAKPPTPHVAWYTAIAGEVRAFVHLGDTVRTVTAPNVATAQRNITSVAIDAFGMNQGDAEAFAAKAAADQTKAADLPKTLSDHVTLLQDQLADHDRDLTGALQSKLKAESDLALAQDELKTANAKIAALEKELAALRTPAAPPPIVTSAAEPVASGSATSAMSATEGAASETVHSGGTSSATVAH